MPPRRTSSALSRVESHYRSPRKESSLPTLTKLSVTSAEPAILKKHIVEAKSGLATVDEYVGKMRNRLDYLVQSEQRMLSKIDRMNEIMQKRE